MLKTTIALSITVICWASAFVNIRQSMPDYSPGSLALLRLLTASFILLLVYHRTPRKHRITLSELIRIAVLGALGIGGYHLLLNTGEQTIPAGIASFIISQIPIFTTLLAIIFLKERLSLHCWVGLIISFCGITVISVGQSQAGHFNLGILYILLAAFFASCYNVFQKPLLTRIHSLRVTAIAIWSGTASLLFYLPDLTYSLQHASRAATLSAIYLGVFPTALAYITWAYALSRISASRAAASLYAMPIIASLLGWLMLSEVPNHLSLLGGMIALAGAVFLNIHYAKKPKPASGSH